VVATGHRPPGGGVGLKVLLDNGYDINIEIMGKISPSVKE
jgi:hypothetical protein